MKKRNPSHKRFFTAKPRSAAKHTRYPQWRLFFVLVFGIFLSGCSGLLGKKDITMVPAPAEFTFDQYEVVTGVTKHQTVLIGFFLGDSIAELAVVNVDENNKRHLRIHAFDDDTWILRLDVPLRPEVLFIDVANIDGRDRLITYERGHLNWFDPESATERVLVEVTTNYNATGDGGIPHVDVTRDVNSDGLDDLVVPDLDGFWIATQVNDGAFTDPIKLGPPDPFLDEIALDDTRSYREVGITAMTIPWYLSRVHQLDYNQDGRSDLVFWNADHFEVYYQDTHGMFSTVAETFTVDIPFDTDGIYSIAFGFSDESAFSLVFGFRESKTLTVLHSFRDMNDDGVADMVILSLNGRSLLSQRSLYAVHFGTSTPDGILFAREASTVIQPQGRAGGLLHSGYSSVWLRDFDADGQIDMMFRDVNIGISGMMRALLGNSVMMDVEFYRIKNGIYPNKPTTTHRIRPHINPFDKQNIFFSPVLMGDVTGDKRLDLLVGKSREELQVFVGVPGPELLARQPKKIAVTLPMDERNTRLVDFNKDSQQDILMYHPSTTDAHRVTLLIAQ
ncbi:MAG: VCBS repeat-containing protein [Candidatus Poribacteria bacterium]|nr:VCBS repeat-containing protein [Candidatus Poribacteria bacterium]